MRAKHLKCHLRCSRSVYGISIQKRKISSYILFFPKKNKFRNLCSRSWEVATPKTKLESNKSVYRIHNAPNHQTSVFKCNLFGSRKPRLCKRWVTIKQTNLGSQFNLKRYTICTITPNWSVSAKSSSLPACLDQPQTFSIRRRTSPQSLGVTS